LFAKPPVREEEQIARLQMNNQKLLEENERLRQELSHQHELRHQQQLRSQQFRNEQQQQLGAMTTKTNRTRPNRRKRRHQQQEAQWAGLASNDQQPPKKKQRKPPQGKMNYSYYSRPEGIGDDTKENSYYSRPAGRVGSRVVGTERPLLALDCNGGDERMSQTRHGLHEFRPEGNDKMKPFRGGAQGAIAELSDGEITEISDEALFVLDFRGAEQGRTTQTTGIDSNNVSSANKSDEPATQQSTCRGYRVDVSDGKQIAAGDDQSNSSWNSDPDGLFSEDAI
jgi:hypothetical protein